MIDAESAFEPVLRERPVVCGDAGVVDEHVKSRQDADLLGRFPNLGQGGEVGRNSLDIRVGSSADQVPLCTPCLCSRVRE